MPFQIFQYSIPGDADLSELNQWMTRHRVVSVHKQVVTHSDQSILLFLIEYLDDEVGETNGRRQRPRVDYRELLGDDEFQLFCRLRDVRQRLAQEEGVALYVIFTNAQIAEMVRNRCTSMDELLKLKGVGEARAKKYGEPMLEVLRDALSNEEAET